jgi:hypothetical protein
VFRLVRIAAKVESDNIKVTCNIMKHYEDQKAKICKIMTTINLLRSSNHHMKRRCARIAIEM